MHSACYFACGFLLLALCFFWFLFVECSACSSLLFGSGFLPFAFVFCLLFLPVASCLLFSAFSFLLLLVLLLAFCFPFVAACDLLSAQCLLLLASCFWWLTVTLIPTPVSLPLQVALTLTFLHIFWLTALSFVIAAICDCCVDWSQAEQSGGDPDPRGPGRGRRSGHRRACRVSSMAEENKKNQDLKALLDQAPSSNATADNTFGGGRRSHATALRALMKAFSENPKLIYGKGFQPHPAALSAGVCLQPLPHGEL